MPKRHLGIWILLMALLCCQPKVHNLVPLVTEPAVPPLFRLVPPDESGVTFANNLYETEAINQLTYLNLYNGGGVSIGDINLDGLPDLFFSGNFVPDKLYLNQGNLVFQDITEAAGFPSDGFSTGVTMADVNEDGWLDIYLCRSVAGNPHLRTNQLFLNQGNQTFVEAAKERGIADPGYSNHATFFDYDRDGDLDLYVLNHRTDFDVAMNIDVRGPDQVNFAADTFVQYETDRLYQNEGKGFYRDVTLKLGMANHAFGLSATASDVNQDGWVDLYVANDFAGKDHLYLNQGNGRFKDEVREQMGHISKNSMGTDIADFNNDGWPDLISVDMIPEDAARQKKLRGSGKYDLYHQAASYGYHHQVMHNALQLNDGMGHFAEIAGMAGVAYTDWSWAPLFADFDNDGWKDLFISNGFRRDVTDLDYLKYLSPQAIAQAGSFQNLRKTELLQGIPSHPVPNYLYRNSRGLKFQNQGTEWGLVQPSFSNGAAYADLDLDGDLDLVVSNLDQHAFLYENQLNKQQEQAFLRVKLHGNPQNQWGTGTRVWIYQSSQTQYQEMQPSRGFFSSVEPILHFGLGKTTLIDSLKVIWPDGKTQVLSSVQPNQLLLLDCDEAGNPKTVRSPQNDKRFRTPSKRLPQFTHKENTPRDFDHQPLVPMAHSNLGPALASADVNGDHLADLFVGGGPGQAGILYLQQSSGGFREMKQPTWEQDEVCEDVEAVFLDADGDGDMDLVVVSGGTSLPVGHEDYRDRLYVNDGQGRFQPSQNLPHAPGSSACVRPFDVDEDGDQDLFIGSFVVPGQYPLSSPSHILLNDGQGGFSSSNLLPNGGQLGMVRDANWVDMNLDGKTDLMLAGYWMPLTYLKNTGGSFENATESLGLSQTNGWWNSLKIADLDDDGDLDMIAGNRGLNSFYPVNEERPAILYVKDFDQNGHVDPIATYPYPEGAYYPIHALDELTTQLPYLKKRFPRYAHYAGKGIELVFTPEELADAQRLYVHNFATSLWINEGAAGFRQTALPEAVQVAPVQDILIADLDGDGMQDLFLVGNQYFPSVETGRYDASFGHWLKGSGKGEFAYIPNRESGLEVRGDSRSIRLIRTGSGRIYLIVAKSGGDLQWIEVEQKPI